MKKLPIIIASILLIILGVVLVSNSKPKVSVLPLEGVVTSNYTTYVLCNNGGEELCTYNDLDEATSNLTKGDYIREDSWLDDNTKISVRAYYLDYE